MAYEIGTADGYTNLLDRLIDFLSNPNRDVDSGSDIDELVAIDDTVQSGEPSQAWTVLELNDNRDSSGDGDMEVFLEGPGTSGVDEIYTWIDTYSDVGDDYYNWRIAGMTGFASGQDISLQPGVTQGRLPRMLMWTNPIDYWFLGNGRRFVVIAKVSGVYEMCYGGFCLPYGLPTQFPYPLCIGASACPGTTASEHRYSSLANNHRGFPSPYSYSTTGVIPQGTFDATNSHYYSTLKILQGTSWTQMGNYYTTFLLRDNCTWPYSFAEDDGHNLDDAWHESKIRENIDGSYPIFPIVMTMNTPSNHILGELQGCFAVPGFGGISAEDTFTISGDTYIAFPLAPNADASEYMCIKKE